MSTAIKLSGKMEGTDRKLFLNILTQEDNKEGFPAFLNEVNNGNKLPGHRVTVFINGKGDNQWLSLRAPLRTLNDDGTYATQPRKNEEGSFLNEKGEVVAEESKAARQFEYLRYTEGGEEQVVFGTIANLNIQNKKSDSTPNAFTVLNTKFYSDADALQIARLTYELKQFDAGTSERKEVEEELTTLRKECGSWVTMFINSGHQALRDMKFEVRSRDPEGPTPN